MNKIITISREYGAGGHSIGREDARQLGIEFYDRDIVQATVKASGFETDLVESEEEDISKIDSILKTICSFSAPTYNDVQTVIHDIQQAVILQLAQKGPCVILGRCANVILREAGIETLDVFIHADDVHRVVRISEMTGCTNATELQKTMAKKDSSRHTYYNRYTRQKWGDSHSYHLTLDSGALGYDLCVKLIIEAARK